jgi:heme o synthase
MTTASATASKKTTKLTDATPKKGPLSLYLELGKSGIVTLVGITVVAGYLAGHRTEVSFHWVHFALTLAGIALLAYGSSALNQIQDRKMDLHMARTSNRPLPSGRLSLSQAWSFTVITLTLGLFILGFLSVSLLGLGLLAVFSYNVLYTLWWKRSWAFAAIPGAVPGSLPVVMGYVAASGNLFAPGGWYLFALQFFWQMPHFWVLALRYRDDYEKGAVPTLPVTYGGAKTVSHIAIWCVAYIAIAFLGPLFLPLGWIYLTVVSLFSVKVLWELIAFSKAPDSKKWLHFFLWVNFSLIAFLGAAALDLWSLKLLTPWIRLG